MSGKTENCRYLQLVAEDGKTLTAMKGKFDIAAAYAWDQATILAEMKKIVENTDKAYGDRTTDGDKALARLEKMILKLVSPSGEDYVDPEPVQHVHRKKAGVEIIPTMVTIDVAQNKETYKVPSHNRDFAILGDLVGLFLSIAINPVPDAAKLENFCFPLLALYAKWLVTLTNGKKTKLASMTQISWYSPPTPRSISNVFLGSSIGGFARSRPDWEDGVCMWRFDVLAAVPGGENPKFTEGNLWTWNNSILRRATADSPLNSVQAALEQPPVVGHSTFGNCAETYPLSSALRIIGGLNNTTNWYGIALRPSQTQKIKTYSARNLALRPGIFNPCANCRYLLNIWQGNLPNFCPHPLDKNTDPELDIQYFPLKPIPA